MFFRELASAAQTTKTPKSTERETAMKGKHGDPGACCGGCS
ncbi:MAG TPA: CCGSCS motif protein [Marinobacter sp.]|uniref:CCGSCS motif protein n=1 Tax=Marinobacter antarcticus TaxID=564117 RepID=A0A831R559_9GAMM|nr:CCGSCS motif protein [Marinobacter sp.]HEA52389.1 CCGSCS motif protein [Marinobacter antarcticus]